MKVWHVLVLAGATAAAWNPGIKLAKRVVTRGSVMDSLRTENQALRRRTALFERISAEKDTLLREVRDAHLLIEGVANELRRIETGDPPGAGESVVEVDDAADREALDGDYRAAILEKLGGVRLRIAEIEDSARARSERLREMASENRQLRDEAERHLATIESQKEIIATYLARIAELESQVYSLAEANQRLTEENGALADSVRTLVGHLHAAYYIAGTKEELIRAGVLTEEGGLFGKMGRTLSPARAMSRELFTRIDRLRDTVLVLPPARRYRIISRHDPELVWLPRDDEHGGEGIRMHITDAARFWAASDYLIIVHQ